MFNLESQRLDFMDFSNKDTDVNSTIKKVFNDSKSHFEELSVNVQRLMIYRQIQQKNTADSSVFIKNILAKCCNGGFNWTNSEDGHSFWFKLIINDNTTEFEKLGYDMTVYKTLRKALIDTILHIDINVKSEKQPVRFFSNNVTSYRIEKYVEWAKYSAVLWLDFKRGFLPSYQVIHMIVIKYEVLVEVGRIKTRRSERVNSIEDTLTLECNKHASKDDYEDKIIEDLLDVDLIAKDIGIREDDKDGYEYIARLLQDNPIAVP